MLPSSYKEGLDISEMPRPNYKPSNRLPTVVSSARTHVPIRQLSALKKLYLCSSKQKNESKATPKKVEAVPISRFEAIEQRMALLKQQAEVQRAELIEARNNLEQRASDIGTGDVVASISYSGITSEQISARLHLTLDEHLPLRRHVKREWSRRLCAAISPRFDRRAHEIGKERWEAMHSSLPYEAPKEASHLQYEAPKEVDEQASLLVRSVATRPPAVATRPPAAARRPATSRVATTRHRPPFRSPALPPHPRESAMQQRQRPGGQRPVQTSRPTKSSAQQARRG